MSIWAPPKLHVVTVKGADEERDALVEEMRRQAHVCIHDDQERRGVVANWADAVECMRQDIGESRWHFIVQDDMELLSGWQQHLERACAAATVPIMGLVYVGDRWAKAYEAGFDFVQGRSVLRGGAVAYNDMIVDSVYQFSKRLRETQYPNDDYATALWFAEKFGVNGPICVTKSIFGSPPLKSLLGHYAKYETAKYTIENSRKDWKRDIYQVREMAEDRSELALLRRELK